MEPLYTYTDETMGLQARVEPTDDGRYAVRLIDLAAGTDFRPTPIAPDVVAAVEHANALAPIRKTVNLV